MGESWFISGCFLFDQVFKVGDLGGWIVRGEEPRGKSPELLMAGQGKN